MEIIKFVPFLCRSSVICLGLGNLVASNDFCPQFPSSHDCQSNIIQSSENPVNGRKVMIEMVVPASTDATELPSKYPNLKVVGFDAGEAQKNAVRSGYFIGSITQDPYSIGFKAYSGESVSDVDTGAKFYNKSNMDDADISGLLYD